MRIKLERSQYKILVLGSGSIGQRHIRNLLSLGLRDVTACDIQQDRLDSVAGRFKIATFTSYEKALAEIEPDIVFICTPPVFHTVQAIQALRSGAHVLVEKPLSNNLKAADELIAEAGTAGRVVRVGYNLRFNPGLLRVSQLLDEGVIGRVLWAYIEFGQYLPDWRPGQDYRENYTARKELGGGIILDATHELDYAMWLLGKPREVWCTAGKVSELEIEVEDCATMQLRFDTGARAVVHVDCIQRCYSRQCKLVGETGTVCWDYSANQVRVFSSETQGWNTFSYDFEPNRMYLGEVESFLAEVAGLKTGIEDLVHARSVLATALAAHEAALSGRWVSLKD